MKKGFFLENDKQRVIEIKDRTGKNLVLRLEGNATRKGMPKTKKFPYTINKVVWGQQSDAPDKVILIEELQWKDSRLKELRFCYRTQTHNGLWWWGQFALMVPKSDIKELLELAKEKGII